MGRTELIAGQDSVTLTVDAALKSAGGLAVDVSPGLGRHGDSSDHFGNAWESAWIDLGGEG